MSEGNTGAVVVVGAVVLGGLAAYYLLKKPSSPPPDGDYVQYLREFYRNDLLRRAENDARFEGAAEEFWALTAGITEYIPGEIYSIYLEVYYRYVQA